MPFHKFSPTLKSLRVSHQLLDLPNGLHFRKLTLWDLKEDRQRITGWWFSNSLILLILSPVIRPFVSASAPIT